MAMTTSIERFRCVHFDATLTRKSDAARHVQAKGDVKRGKGRADPKLSGYQRCATCPIGIAHAKGETPSSWEDGTPLELSSKPTLTTPDRSAPRADEPTSSRSDLARSSAGPTRHETSAPAEDEIGEPGAGPGAGAAQQSAAERPSSEGSESTAAGGAGRAPDHQEERRMAKTAECRACGETFEKTAPAQRYCTREECTSKREAEKKTAKPKKKAKSTTKASTSKSSTTAKKTAIDPVFQVALDGIDAKIDERERAINAIEAELDKLCAAGNAICDAAGIPHQYEAASA